jgi:PBP1b-binding outer membrane lipoprotein LpoB
MTSSLTVNNSLTVNGTSTINGTLTVASALTLSGVINLGEKTKFYSQILPGVSDNSSFTIGNSDNLWSKGYFSSGITTSSDRRLKENIEDISDKYTDLLLELPVRTYQLINEDKNVTHTGFIAQELEELLNKYNLEENEFAALDKNKKTTTKVQQERVVDNDGNIIQEEITEIVDVLDEDGNIDYNYGLNYSEFIPILTALIQRQQKQIDELTQKINNLINGEIK